MNPRLSTRFNQLSPYELRLTFLFALVLWTAAGPFLGERELIPFQPRGLKFRPFTLPQTLKLKFCRGTIRPTSFCTVSLVRERSFICPRKCIGRLWKWWCDYLWLRSLTTGAFSKLAFQSVCLKWVYSDCFPLDRKQQANWIRWDGIHGNGRHFYELQTAWNTQVLISEGWAKTHFCSLVLCKVTCLEVLLPA